jgi:hypothetical protein
MKNLPTPENLYKYRTFNVHTLRMLTDAEVYYANPEKFNDPLDCRPTIRMDTELPHLEKLCYKMCLTINGKDPAVKKIKECRYMSTQFGDFRTNAKARAYYSQSLAAEIQNLLYKEMENRGVLTLGGRWNCPLMWSHYADEHRGICIEYTTTDSLSNCFKAVSYNKARGIKISTLIDWKINSSREAECDVLNSFFFQKAPQWRYEREWRDINGTQGITGSPFKISGIYFGHRCDPAVKTCIVKMLVKTERPIKFFEIYEDINTFNLKRRSVDTDEIESRKLAYSVSWGFEPCSSDEPSTP